MEIQKYLNQPLQVSKEWQPLNNGLIVDNEIVNSFNGDKLNLVSPIVLRENLAYIFTLLGFKNYPDKEEMVIIEDFIRSSYPLYTIQEFRIAFKMAVQGKMDCSTEHYEKFSPKFIGQIMLAYTKKANEIRKMLKPIIKEIEPPKLTDDQIVSFTMKEWLESAKKDFNRVFNADKVFGILIKQGKLKIEQQEIDEILKIVRDDNQYKLNKMSVLEGKEFSKLIKDEDYIESQCKKLAIVKYFESLPS
jgi:mRNA-degrading endonuclease HigB of HigAB toxin-antitoxin module